MFVLLFVMGCASAPSKPLAHTVPPEYEADTPLATEINASTVAFVHKEASFTDGSVDNIFRPYCTGVWVSERVILTAHHCVEGARSAMGAKKLMGLQVKLITANEVVNVNEDTKEPWKAEVIAVDEKRDMALVSVLGAAKLLPKHDVARLAASSPGVGSKVHIVGHVKGLYWSYMEGVVSSYRKEIPMSNVKGPFMQVSAPVYLGNSGGGAFNSSGQLVGMISFISGAPNAGFYISLKNIKQFVHSNIK